MPDTGTVDYSPPVVLSIATQAIHNWAGSLIAGAGQGRGVTILPRAITSAALDVNGQVYELPPMASADAIDAVTWVDSSTNTERRLQTVPRAMESVFSQPASSGCPEVYTLEDGTLRVLPKPTVAGTLRIQYQRRHGVLVSGSDTTSVISSAANGSNTNVVVGAVPTSFVIGAWVDFFGRYYPHRTKIHGARITNIVGTTVTLALTYADVVAAGVTDDTVCIYGKTPYVQLPLELRSPLTQHIKALITTDLGDMQSASAADQLAAAGAARAQEMLSPRVHSTPQKVYNPRGLMRGGMRRRWPGDSR